MSQCMYFLFLNYQDLSQPTELPATIIMSLSFMGKQTSFDNRNSFEFFWQNFCFYFIGVPLFTHMGDLHICFIIFFNFFSTLFIFGTERDRAQVGEGQRDRERERHPHRIQSRLQAPSCQHRAQHRTRTHKL